MTLSLLMVIFMFPETKWNRAEAIPPTLQSERHSHSHSSDEKVDIEHKESTITRAESDDTAERDPWLGKGVPNKRQWGLYTPSPNPWKAIALDLWVPWKLFAFPIVEFSSFVVSWSCSTFLAVNLTQSQNFAAPPYNFDSQSIGFMNFAILGGAGVGLATAGPLSDWVSARATRKNNGIRESEMRLPAMSKYFNLERWFLLTEFQVPYVLIMILGNLVVAYGYDRKWPWEAIVIIGYGCAGIQVAALPAMATTYAVDSYKPAAGSLMVSITINKNLWGYGMSEFITPWVDKSGFIPPIMTNCGLVTLFCLMGIPFYYYGKTFRRWTKDSSVHRL